MATAFEELRVLQDAEAVADEIWQQVVGWDPFATERNFSSFYYARGSLFETKYWLNRALERGMMTSERGVQDYASRLTSLARQLNSFAGRLKAQRQDNQARLKAVREKPPWSTRPSAHTRCSFLFSVKPTLNGYKPFQSKTTNLQSLISSLQIVRRIAWRLYSR